MKYNKIGIASVANAVGVMQIGATSISIIIRTIFKVVAPITNTIKVIKKVAGDHFSFFAYHSTATPRKDVRKIKKNKWISRLIW